MESQRHPGRKADREGALFNSRWVRLHARCLLRALCTRVRPQGCAVGESNYRGLQRGGYALWCP
jgi:hypothetical protein